MTDCEMKSKARFFKLAGPQKETDDNILPRSIDPRDGDESVCETTDFDHPSIDCENHKYHSRTLSTKHHSFDNLPSADIHSTTRLLEQISTSPGSPRENKKKESYIENGSILSFTVDPGFVYSVWQFIVAPTGVCIPKQTAQAISYACSAAFSKNSRNIRSFETTRERPSSLAAKERRNSNFVPRKECSKSPR